MEWSWGMSLAHTDPTDLTEFAFDDVKSHGGREKGRGHIGVLRVLRFPKLTQIQQDSTKNNL